MIKIFFFINTLNWQAPKKAAGSPRVLTFSSLSLLETVTSIYVEFYHQFLHKKEQYCFSALLNERLFFTNL